MTDKDIDATKAPLMDHLIELRSRLIRALIAFLLAFLVCFYFSRAIYNILTHPYVSVVGAENAKLIATHFLEQFFTNIRLSMFGAGVIAFNFSGRFKVSVPMSSCFSSVIFVNAITSPGSCGAR